MVGLTMLEVREGDDVEGVAEFLRREIGTAEAYSPKEREESAAEVTAEALRGEMLLGYRRVLAARESNGALAAVGLFWREPEVWCAGWVAVRADLRGQGVLRGLVPEFLRWLDAQGVLSLRSECRTVNHASRALMVRVGFVPLQPSVVSYGGRAATLFALDVKRALWLLARGGS